MRWLFVIGVVLGGVSCGLTSNAVVCDDGRTCPEATVCDTVHSLCVAPDQIAQCEGQPDRTTCDVAGRLGTCQQGVCLEASCGNGREDVTFDVACAERDAMGACLLPYEVCDDANNADGDGCSGNCLSDESCGNLLIDSINGETCDDGNLLDNDGCSSACRVEIAQWLLVRDPGPLSHARAVFDAARRKVVMFGGRSTNLNARTNATTEWDGQWRAGLPVAAPSARGHALVTDQNSGFGMAYDHARRVSIVVGGAVNGVANRETWAWDGQTWTGRPDFPTEIQQHAMAYDAKRERIVVYGGFRKVGGSDEIVGDTYEFDGTSWITMAPTTSPPRRRNAGMTYDPKRGVIVMFGGFGDDFATRSELWEYDGTTWTKRLDANNAGVPSLGDPTLAFDSASNRVVIYGHDIANRMWFWNGTALAEFLGAMPTSSAVARQAPVLVNDGNGRLMMYGGCSNATDRPLLTTQLMWFFDGSTWVEAATSAQPLLWSAMAEAHDRGVVVRFGGNTSLNNGPAAVGDTWELSRRGWLRFTTGNPPAMQASQMVYDSARDLFFLFGGTTDNGSVEVVQNETWTRTGQTWVRRAPTATWPVARGGHAMAYDAARDEAVMFGGLDVGGQALDDTWVWNGTAWIERTPATKPPARAGGAMAYDKTQGVVVMFGGNPNEPDTWLWDGTNWEKVIDPQANRPSPRLFASLTWNPARQAIVLAQSLFGSTFDVWEWRTTGVSPAAGTWSPILTVTTPAQRGLGGNFATLDGSGVTIYQGADTSTGVLTSEVWEFRFAAQASAGDSCTVPFDVDGDALVGCEDDDCWLTCQPDCPPGSSCPATAQSCGDGTCGIVENCRICPQDCTTCVDTRCGDFICDPGEACPGDCP